MHDNTLKQRTRKNQQNSTFTTWLSANCHIQNLTISHILFAIKT